MSTVEAEPKLKTKKSGDKKVKKDKVVNESSEVVSELEPVVAPVPEPVPAPVLAPVPEPELVAVEELKVLPEESNIEILFNKLIIQFQDIQSVMKTLHSNLKVLQKEVLKEQKESKKKESKIKKKSDKKRAPSGFAKPALITNDLADFLDLPHGSQLARTEVTTKVIKYVKDHNLQNPAQKVQILPDAKLAKLLQAGSDDVIKFFNLQTYLKKHFIAPTPVVV
jgi:chromatin remodeling complex protein RSC6